MKVQSFYKLIFFVSAMLFGTSIFAQAPTLPAPPSTTLPLSLISFSTSSQNGANQLFWKTDNEVNMKSFEVQKSSDGQSFSVVATISAANNASNSYNFSDNNALNLAYYRLKMNGKDGSFQYSFIVVVKNKPTISVSMYPNPTVNFVTVTHGAPVGKANLAIVSITGKNVQTVAVTNGTQQTSFGVSNIKQGAYLLQFTDDRGVQTLQFIKQ